jgi:hypothetical protein
MGASRHQQGRGQHGQASPQKSQYEMHIEPPLTSVAMRRFGSSARRPNRVGKFHTFGGALTRENWKIVGMPQAALTSTREI